MDIFTLIISTALVSFFMFVITLLIYKTSKLETYLIDWSCAGMAFCLSNIISIIGTYNTLPFIYVALANTCYILGHACIFTGTIKLTVGTSHWRKLVCLSIFVLILHYLDFTQSSVENRILTFYPIILCFCLSIILVAWKQRKSLIGKALWLLIVVESLFAIQLVLRATYMIVDSNDLALFGSEFMQTSGTLSLLIFLFLMSLTFVFIFSWKKELRLREHSRTDYLTGWFNRRALVETATNMFQRCLREKSRFGVIIFDIDHFKKVNDAYGHSIGDKTLKYICDIAKQTKRSYDCHFRLGGEEFAILVGDSGIEDIDLLAERIRSSIEASPLKFEGNTIAITISIGISLLSDQDNSWEDVLDRADNALYQAKKLGRNQIKTTYERRVESLDPMLVTSSHTY